MIIVYLSYISNQSLNSDLKTSIYKQHRRIDQLETDNKRLANHNQRLLAQLTQKVGDQGGNSVQPSRSLTVSRHLPAKMAVSVGSIQIAEPDSVIISGKSP